MQKTKQEQSTQRTLKKLCCILICQILCGSFLTAQMLNISVQNEAGQPLESVKATAGNHQSISNAKGILSVPATADTIHFSRLGYQSRKVRLKEISGNKVVLQPSEIYLPQILVVAADVSRDLPTLNTRIIHPDTDLKMGDSASLLRQISSLSSQDTQLVGEHQSLSILGSLSRHTLVLLDGVPLNAAGEAFDFSKIPLSQIERIEIMKGNVSALVGQSAIGGAVNIISKKERRKQDANLEIGLSTGSYAMQRQDAKFDYQFNNYSFAASFERYRTNNDFKYRVWWQPGEDLKRLHNAKAAENYFFKGSYLGKKQHLEYSLNFGNFDRELPGPVSFLPVYDAAGLSGKHAYHTLGYSIYHRALADELKLFYQNDNSLYKNLNSSNPVYPSHYRQNQTHAGLQNRLHWDYQKARFSLLNEYRNVEYDFHKYQIASHAAADAKGKRKSHAIGLIYDQDLRLRRWDSHSQFAIREDYADKKWHLSQRLEQSFSLEDTDIYSFGFTLGNAFALPSMYDMYWIGDSQSLGNPDLKSEKSRAFSLHAGYDHPILSLNASYHYNNIQNLIQWQQVYLFGSQWKPFNVGKTVIQNLEANLETRPMHFLLFSAGLTLTDARDYTRLANGNPSATYGKYLTYTPRHKTVFALKYEDEHRQGTVSYSLIGKQYSTADNLIDPLKAYEILDFGIQRKLSYKIFSFSAEARLNNVLDNTYEVYAHVPQPGRNWSLGIQAGIKY